MKIIECYGTGPSLGFIIDGRVGADNFTSLYGSLAPANTINNIIRGIPIIGKVLTGKKGDGIFGASFKIKGTKELKTEVNPIRTITPRFVQRFLLWVSKENQQTDIQVCMYQCRDREETLTHIMASLPM